jgi:predicted nucleic acid-binding protein
MSVIANTTVISNFAGIDRLELLRRLYTTLYISTEVYAEVQQGIAEGYAFYEGIDWVVYPLAEDGWIHLASIAGADELRLFSTLPAQLHPGEASCIAIARGRGWQFLSDDRAARQMARKLEVNISGTVGCLALAVEKHLCDLTQANNWLQAMIRKGFRSPVFDLTPLLAG